MRMRMLRAHFLSVGLGAAFALASVSQAVAGGAVARMEQEKQMRMQAMQQQQMSPQEINIHMQGGLPPELLMQQQPVDPAEVKDVVDIVDLFKSLDQSSEAWALIIDPPAKALVISRYIDLFKNQGVTITKSPVYYSVIIDSMASTSPEMLKRPFQEVLMIAAVVEYDFDNGQDKDSMAIKILGTDGFAENKKRLGL